ncbi:MAG: UTRA domain-containing protein [Erysipelotrichaceae bacterium]|nr:UTRA domain-containing protein [Erysipelotrichaceae bacterium]
MPQSKYEPIYHAIKNDIESKKYQSGDFLPSENEFAARFGCSRNTVRRAISLLTAEGYLLPQHGRGVQVIFRPEKELSLFTIGGIESFAEAASRSSRKATTKIVTFKEVKCDQSISMMTGFDVGDDLYYIERVRYLGKQAVIYDTNIFLISETKGLTEEIARDSIYRYLEDTLGMTITTSRRRVTAERATERDHELLDLGHFDFVLTVVGQVFNSRGVMFEYTRSRHVPDQVCFAETAVRQKV